MGTTRKYKNLEVENLIVKGKLTFTHKDGGKIEVNGLKGSALPTKLLFVDRDGATTHEFILNTSDGTSGDIRHNGRVRRIV